LSPGRTGFTSTTSCAATTRHPVARALRQPRCAPRILVSRLQWLYLDYAARPDASAPHAARPGSSARRAAHCAARRRLLLPRRASGCLGTSRGSSRGSSSPTSPIMCDRVPRTSRGSSRGTSRGMSRGSSSTTLPMSRVRVPWHVAWLVVDYFAYAARPGATARRAARHAAHHRLLRLCCAIGCLGTSRVSSSTTSRLATRLLVGRSHCLSPCVRSLRLAARLLIVRIALALLRLCRASGCAVSTLDFSSVGRTGSRRVPSHSVVRRDYPSHGRNGYTSPTSRVRVPRHVAWLVVDYFTYAVRPVASARRAACRMTHRRLLRLAQARHRLLRLRRASGCLGTSRGSSRGSSSTTSPRAGSSSTTSFTPRVWVPQHVTRLVVDYFTYTARSGASVRRATRHTGRRRLLCAP
jgi:hypothetical protein